MSLRTMIGLAPDDWELVDKTVLPSIYEQMKEADTLQFVDDLYRTMFTKTVIFTFRNRRDGRIRQKRFQN